VLSRGLCADYVGHYGCRNETSMGSRRGAWPLPDPARGLQAEGRVSEDFRSRMWGAFATRDTWRRRWLRVVMDDEDSG
jgi:hypothetical protein